MGEAIKNFINNALNLSSGYNNKMRMVEMTKRPNILQRQNKTCAYPLHRVNMYIPFMKHHNLFTQV